MERRKYEKLRRAHREKRFEHIAYCKNCDFLYDDQDTLVWSNDLDAKIGNVLGTDIVLMKEEM